MSGLPDFPLILSQLVSTNPNDAFSLIEKLRKENLGLFLLEMAKQMVGEDVPSNCRQMAALVIKNSVIGPSKQATNELSTQWLAIPNEQRNLIKQLLIQGLSLPNVESRTSASQVVGQIGARELVHGQWQDLISLLVNNMTNGSPILKEGTLNALGVLCEEIPQGILESQSTQILAAIVSGTNPNVPIEIYRASIKALLGTICFIEHHFEKQEERDCIMKVIVNAASSQDREVRLLAMQCLVRTAEFHYIHLASYFEAIWKITLAIIKSDADPVAQQAIEFWSTLCDVEIEIYLDIADGDAAPNIVIHHVIKNVAQYLVPVLFECLTKQEENIYEDEWNTAKCASACLTLVAQTLGDDIVPVAIPFISGCINNENWRYKEAAALALGCITDGPSENSKMCEFLVQCLPILVRHIKEDPSLLVQDTSAWTIGKICMHFPSVIEKHAFPIIEALIIGTNSPEPIIAVQTCNSLLYALSIFSYDGEETSPFSGGFSVILKALVDASDRPGACENNLCVTAYEAINVLIREAADDCQDTIISVIPPFIEKLAHTFDPSVDIEIGHQLQSYIPSVLQTITVKIGELIAPFAEKLIQIFIQIFEFRRTIIDEPMVGISSVLSECENLIPLVFPQMKRYLIAAFSCPEEINSLIASLHCFSVICECENIDLFQHDNGAFCDQIVQCFFKILQNPNAPFIAKPEIFSTFGDLSLSIGKNFERYFASVMQALESASMIQIQDENDDRMIDNIIQLRQTILGTYSMFTHANIESLSPHFAHLLKFFEIIWRDTAYRTKDIIKQVILLISDIHSQNTVETEYFIATKIIQEIIHFCRHLSTVSKVRNVANKIR